MWPMIIGAAVGLLKDREAQAEANRERKVQAAMTRYSPWTGMQGQMVANPSLLGNVAQGAAAGGAFGQSLNSMNSGNAANAASEVSDANKIASTDIPSFGDNSGSAGYIGGAQVPSRYRLMNPGSRY